MHNRLIPPVTFARTEPRKCLCRGVSQRIKDSGLHQPQHVLKVILMEFKFYARGKYGIIRIEMCSVCTLLNANPVIERVGAHALVQK